MTEDDRRRRLLTVSLGFLLAPVVTPSLYALHAWLDSWAGLGLVVVGMERQGFALSLHKMHGGGWRASFYRDPMTSAAGFASAPMPWEAVQRAAWGALKPSRPL
jgi:hypothetical protein